uniref:Peptidase M13 C-terminal domain-containing protein n=1 Tax=viral metagenome TaxID=1070528 RepID=A0A6C0KM10_9ZZZZ
MKTKTNKKIKNGTKKCLKRNKKNHNLNKKQIQLYCQQHANTFNQFEKDYEKQFENSLKTEDTNIEKRLVKMFKTPFSPTKYKSQDDYYTYINYQWLETKSEQIKKDIKYYVQVDSFRITQEKVFYELIDIAKEYIKNNNSPKAIAIKNVYESLYNLDNKSVQNYIDYYVQYIDKQIASNNIYEILGNQNKNEIISWGSPIVWSVSKDEKNNDYYITTITPPQLTIYDYVIYIEDVEEDQNTIKYKKLFKKKYLEFINDMFNLCLGRNHGLDPNDIWNCEFDLLTAMGCDDIKNEDPDGYNIILKEESLKKYNFDWEKMATVIGYKNIPNKFMCTNKNYLKCILTMLLDQDNWKSKKWRTYYLYICFRQVMRFHSEWRLVYFNFHRKFVLGQQTYVPREIYPIIGLSICFNTFLTNEYIDKNKKQQYVDYTFNMAADLLEVYKRIIKRNTWLSARTKKYALLKLENIKLLVGSPKILREDPILAYDNKNAYYNLEKIAFWRANELIKLDGTKSEIDIPIIDWSEFKMVGKQSYIVNAYYTPIENSIYVPLAYLQKPFIDLDERGIEYNLAFIGYTLAHEMSHCLDDMGSKYDYKGNLFNWWTKQDRKKFDSKVKNVIKQYETFASYDGIKMDASLSTGENLADISGLAICEEYLRDFQDKNDDIVPIRALSFHAFFVYIAIQARQQIYDKAIKAQLKTNPHPMDKYRTNCPLARLELFRSLYNIKKKDKMYWPSTDTIW